MAAIGRSADLRGDTIAAVATAPGRGALALVRLSGTAASAIAARVCEPWPLGPRRPTRARLHRPGRTASPLDESLVTHFPAPHSATGEDLVEFSVHGGHRVPASILAALVEAGARPALAGEFTERAVRNGKLDLLQAEAIADLIDARSGATQRAALTQLSGALSRRLLELREAVLGVEALIAYELDFPEEDDGPQPRQRAAGAARAVLATIGVLLATQPRAELGRDGVTVVLAGAPNAGKSSLFNALVGDARAIVSEVPGTTRDAIEVLLDDEPWPLRLVDTAGLRESDDVVERLGVDVSERRLAAAHLVLVCGDSDEALVDGCARVATVTPAPCVAVRTKVDLRADRTSWEAPALLARRPSVAVSATTGEGLARLRETMRIALAKVTPDPAEELPIITRARHAQSLQVARSETQAFLHAWEVASLPAPVAATHLRAAVHALDELIGAIDVDEVMGLVFATFCVGK